MNETIGVKGGGNDQRRRKKIINNKKKKEEIAELEKKVKRQQRYTLIKTIPIAIIGGTIKTVYNIVAGGNNDKDNKKTQKEEIRISEDEITPEDIEFVKRKKKQKDNKKKEETTVVVTLRDGKQVKIKVPNTTDITSKKDDLEQEEYVVLEEKTKEKRKNDREEEKESALEEYNINYDFTTSEIDEDLLPIEAKEKLQKLKARKIIDSYEEDLKEIRYELRKLTSDYYVLECQSENIVFSKDAEEILNKLSDVIDKIDELKRRIRIDDLDKYDDNYIYTLIEEYLEEFKYGKVISEIKDSPLYIMIAEKLEELDKEKNSLDKKVKKKKKELEEKEEHFNELKERLFSIESFNKEMEELQKEQEKMIEELQAKINEAVSVEEKVKIEAELMDKQSRRILNLIALQLLLPGARSAKRISALSAAYLYFMKNMVNPKTTERKYKVITVKDYRPELENNIDILNDASNMLYKTEKEIDRMIQEIKSTYRDYIGLIPECDHILSNLNKIKGDIREKEYEMDKIKSQQVSLLEKNTAKVKKRGEYLM